MITAKYYFNHTKGIVCENCHRKMPLIVTFTLDNDYEFRLCEDCSNALGSLHIACLTTGKNHMYDQDEINMIE